MFKIAAKPVDVRLRRGAEKLFVLVAKGRWVFIAHTEPGADFVHFVTPALAPASQNGQSRAESITQIPAYAEEDDL